VTIFEVCLAGDLSDYTVVIVWAESRIDAIAAAGEIARKRDPDTEFTVLYVNTHESGQPFVIGDFTLIHMRE
jgi:hypothetical protein